MSQHGWWRRLAPSVWRAASFAALAIVAVYVLIVAGKGFIAAFDNADFPESLAVKLEGWPVIFPVHMVTGALALLVVPLVVGLRHTRWHRWAGRAAAVIIAIAGVSAYPVAAYQPVTAYSGAGFITQATVWMTLLGFAIWSIRRGRVAQHRAAMLMMAAVTSGAVFFRLWLGLWVMTHGYKHFLLAYSLDAWLAWSLPLAAVAIWLWRGGRALS